MAGARKAAQFRRNEAFKKARGSGSGGGGRDGGGGGGDDDNDGDEGDSEEVGRLSRQRAKHVVRVPPRGSSWYNPSPHLPC